MSIEKATLARPARVIVVGNEKGGSGKSTVAMHIAMALIKSGQSVATIDLDSRQRSFTHYIGNRRAWARHVGRDLEIPNHTCFDPRSIIRLRRTRRQDARLSARPSMHWRKATALS